MVGSAGMWTRVPQDICNDSVQVTGEAAEVASHPSSMQLSRLLAAFAKQFTRLGLVGNTSYKPKVCIILV